MRVAVADTDEPGKNDVAVPRAMSHMAICPLVMVDPVLL
jgi:hypothetical protein